MNTKTETEFDADYYRRFYRDRKTRCADPSDVQRTARFLTSYLAYVQFPVHSILDMGAGLALLRKPLLKHWPDATYTGVERSAYACEVAGLVHGSVVDFRMRGRADLVICQGVLQYLTDHDAALAIDNLARLCKGVLFLDVLTADDWQRNAVDKERTDGLVHLRAADFYRDRLDQHFVPMGGGLFVRQGAKVALYSLEAQL
jgi:trans-aconitate methyltransferase